MDERDREVDVEALSVPLQLTGVADAECPPRAEATLGAGDVGGAEIDSRVVDAVGQRAEQLSGPAADVQHAITVAGAHVLVSHDAPSALAADEVRPQLVDRRPGENRPNATRDLT